MVYTNCYRKNVFALFGILGGIMYTMKNMGNGVNKTMNKIQVDNSMISRLYSVQNNEENTDVQVPENYPIDKTKLIEELERRKRWQYSYRKMSIFCCFCCKKKTTKDKLNSSDNNLFEQGRKMLHNEIDILSIVKQLRINSFATDLILTPSQKNLVSFFGDFDLKLRLEKDEEEKEKQTKKEKKRKEEKEKKSYQQDSPLIESKDDLEQNNYDGFIEKHHLFVTPELKAKAIEGLKKFDCSKNILDLKILKKVYGKYNMAFVYQQLGIPEPSVENQIIQMNNLFASRDNLFHQNSRNISKTQEIDIEEPKNNDQISSMPNVQRSEKDNKLQSRSDLDLEYKNLIEKMQEGMSKKFSKEFKQIAHLSISGTMPNDTNHLNKLNATELLSQEDYGQD